MISLIKGEWAHMHTSHKKRPDSITEYAALYILFFHLAKLRAIFLISQARTIIPFCSNILAMATWLIHFLPILALIKLPKRFESCVVGDVIGLPFQTTKSITVSFSHLTSTDIHSRNSHFFSIKSFFFLSWQVQLIQSWHFIFSRAFFMKCSLSPAFKSHTEWQGLVWQLFQQNSISP